jgi:omega-6 fatty acid desaturase (delta-12 desaturase)
LPEIFPFRGAFHYNQANKLSPKIPNYEMPKSYKENEVFQVPPMTILASLSALRMRLYDEERHRMVGWCVIRSMSTTPSD